MILLQQAGPPLPPPPPEKLPSLPMSVATRPAANLLLSPQKPLGLGSSLPLAQDEELATVVEQDPVLEELCKPLCCRLCNVTLNSAQQAQAHYQGKNHSKKLRNYYAANSCPAPARMSSSLEPATHSVASLPPQQSCKASPYFNPRSRQRIPRDLAMCVTPSGQFYCSMCNAGASEEMEFRQHLESKQHKSKVSEQRYKNEMENLGYVQ
ncbi:PREDICTED: zinc finger matrin-type protein 3 [Gekko japonicus]|uniref:Zinc finger matrin-type protein 3 n=1 Tax=Gekko japonicus TaxID=146911 RepID=A0ABM1K0J1_GEKJA|nr:PREDICTED: zinc finger matrin-type protein 3 [Gekko japonicus]